jgi:transcriptional regulator with XRE-family HTH domain
VQQFHLMPGPDAQAQLDSAAVLTRATLRAAEKLGLSQRDLARLLGVSPASMSRLSRGRAIDPFSKEGELALLFLRLFRSLDALVGGDEVAARAWFHARNLHLDGVPAELVAKVDGLVHAVEYLDAVRGRL